MSLKNDLLKRKYEFLPLWDERHIDLMKREKYTNEKLIEDELENWINVNLFGCSASFVLSHNCAKAYELVCEVADSYFKSVYVKRGE